MSPPLLPGLPPEGRAADSPPSKPAISRGSIAVFVVLALILAVSMVPKHPVRSDVGPSYPLEGITAAFGSSHAMLLWIVFLVGVPVLLWAFGLFDR